MTDVYLNMATKIIKSQAQVVGPLAWSEANKLKNISIKDETVALTGKDSKQVLDQLVGQYETLFGQASVEVCREAVKTVTHDMDEADVPSRLK